MFASMIGYNHKTNNKHIVYFLLIERSSSGAAISMVSYLVEELTAGVSWGIKVDGCSCFRYWTTSGMAEPSPQRADILLLLQPADVIGLARIELAASCFLSLLSWGVFGGNELDASPLSALFSFSTLEIWSVPWSASPWWTHSAVVVDDDIPSFPSLPEKDLTCWNPCVWWRTYHMLVCKKILTNISWTYTTPYHSN